MKKVTSLLFATVMVCACGQSSGDQFVGDWTKVSGQGVGLRITKNGDSFVVTQRASLLGGKDLSFAGELKGDGLTISTGFNSARYVIEKSTGHLVGAGEVLERASK